VITQKAKPYSTSAPYHDDGPPTTRPKHPRRLQPAEGWLVLVLLAIALYSVVLSIRVVNWVDNSSLLLSMPACGLLVGLTIAKIPRFPQSILHLAACLIGHWLTVWLTSAVAFHIPWIQVLVVLRAAFSGQVGSMGIAAGKIVFFFYLSFLCFFLGYFGCWLIYRAHLPWLVAFVYCSIMLVNLNYVRRQMDFLIIVLLASLLLLIARMSLMRQIAQWSTEGVHTTDPRWLRSIVGRCMLVACTITLLALLFASSLPVLAQPENGQIFWSNLQVTWNDLLTAHVSLQDINKVMSSFSQASGNYFSDQLTIADSVRLPAGEVLTYRDGSGNQPHYLEGLTYNLFDGHNWRSSVVSSRSYGRGQPLPITLHNTDRTGSVTVALTQIPYGAKDYIFGPEQPFSFSVPTQIYMDGTIAAWTQQTPLYFGENYNVSFDAPALDATMLSQIPLPAASQNVWDADPYYVQQKVNDLEVPGDLSPTVGQTTMQWTQGTNSAYKAMKMLEEHFNDTNVFTYSLVNEPIPANKDVVDWLLETRQGYCTYYASAMAIMGRLLGIPTRVVSGFSQGHFDQQRNLWVVDGNDAHSWVQAYLPNVGWVSFDPTPSFAPNAAPSPKMQPTPQSIPTHMAVPQLAPTQHPAVSPIATVHATSSSNTPRPMAANHQGQGILAGITIAGLILALLCGLAAIVYYWWRRFYTSSVVVEVLFSRCCQVASWVGLGPKAWQTPYEYSLMLSRQFPDQAAPLSRLAKLFVRERWGVPRRAPRKLETAEVTYLWKAMRSLVLSRLAQILRSWRVNAVMHLLKEK
jgi:hypothetical protein